MNFKLSLAFYSQENIETLINKLELFDVTFVYQPEQQTLLMDASKLDTGCYASFNYLHSVIDSCENLEVTEKDEELLLMKSFV